MGRKRTGRKRKRGGGKGKGWGGDEEEKEDDRLDLTELESAGNICHFCKPPLSCYTYMYSMLTKYFYSIWQFRFSRWILINKSKFNTGLILAQNNI